MRIVGREAPFTLIQPNAGESVQRVLLAIARASFEIAQAEDREWLRCDLKEVGFPSPKVDIPWEKVRHLVKINPEPKPGQPMLRMDYLANVRCKARVVKGRKYLRFYSGDNREAHADMILKLALRYL